MRLLLYLGLCWSLGAHGGTVRQSDVRYEDGIYYLEMAMAIEADQPAVRTIITDYARLDRLSNLLTETSLLDAPAEDGIRRRLVSRLCILFFCFSSVIVEDVEEIGDQTVLTTVVPELSDYRYGFSRWTMKPLENNQTLVRFRYEMEPDFWIPPLIGPLLIKGKLQREAENTIEKIETLAREPSFH